MPTELDFPQWLSDAIDGLVSGNVDAWMDLYTDDAVHEFPFAAPGAVRRLEGRAAIQRFMGEISERVHFGHFSDVRVREIGDELVVEAEGHHRDAATGTPFDLCYVWIITRHGGRVSRIRDYMGPRRAVGEQN